MVLALEGDSTMTTSCLRPPASAEAPRGSLLAAPPASRLAGAALVLLRPVAGRSPASGVCFLRAGTAVSWLRGNVGEQGGTGAPATRGRPDGSRPEKGSLSSGLPLCCERDSLQS